MNAPPSSSLGVARAALAAPAALLLLAIACGQPPAPPPPADWQPGLEKWRSEREAGLKRPNGWMSLVGLWWLQPGETPFGSAPTTTVYRDYQKHGAVRLPSTQVQRILGIEQVVTFTSYEFNVVPGGAFDLPAVIKAIAK